MLLAPVPGDIVELAAAAQIIEQEPAIHERAVHELARVKTRPTENTLLELDLHEDRLVEQAPIPFAISDCTAYKYRVYLASLGVDARKIAIAEYVTGPPGRFQEATLEIFGFE